MKDKRVLSILKIMIIIVIIIILIIVAKILEQQKNLEEEYGNIGGNKSSEDIKMPTKVTNETMFYTVEDCIQKYLTISSYNLNQTEEEKKYKNSIVEFQTEEEKKQAIYDVLSQDYIEQYNITMNNIKNYTHYSSNELYFTAKVMNYIQDGTMEKYGVYGKIRLEQNYANSKDTYFIVTIDKSKLTFTLEPILEIEDIDITQIVLDNIASSVEKNSYNTFEYDRVSESELPTRYIAHYKGLALYNPTEAYEYLDQDYKEKRFGSLENYIQYVNDNKNDINKIFIDKYQKTEKDGYTQYVCIDTNGNYYIFKETATMQYTLLLDTYTMDIPEFTEKYYAGNEQVKVGMNIEKIVAALNNKDYGYVYGKLSDGFKNNYFKTQEEFENYAKQNFYQYNKVDYYDFKSEGQNYIYVVEIKDRTHDMASMEKTFMMKLNDGTDFVFSFNVN